MNNEPLQWWSSALRGIIFSLLLDVASSLPAQQNNNNSTQGAKLGAVVCVCVCVTALISMWGWGGKDSRCLFLLKPSSPPHPPHRLPFPPPSFFLLLPILSIIFYPFLLHIFTLLYSSLSSQLMINGSPLTSPPPSHRVCVHTRVHLCVCLSSIPDVCRRSAGVFLRSVGLIDPHDPLLSQLAPTQVPGDN